MRLFLRKVDPPATPKQKTQNKSENIAVDKSMSMSSKLKNSLLENMNISPTLDTLVILPPLDYNIIGDMNKTRENIIFFDLGKIQSQRDILLRTLGHETIDNATFTSK